MSRFHCCATCKHFKAVKLEQRMMYYCERLRYETKPTYQFNCWEPKKHVQQLIEKEQRKNK
ncbi:hypothetical protein [Bacillus sp. CGMCC 1.16541]|uniref:hypothetical protein n=1 Tax=Bacillus sp. CGMCC 1.16541 TaxID=2185143 RepID=UPI000D73CB88|nr:hypothetical protein [Bacillus sp. CGMCC 1.16541]